MRRGWFIAAIVVGVGVIVAAVVISKVKDNGSSSSTVATTTWANSVCTDLSDWKSSITSLASVSGGTLNKSSLQQKLDEAKTATDQLVTSLKDLGPPDLESGDQLKQQLNSDADALQSSYESLQSGAQAALNAGGPTAILNALAALAPDFQKLLNEISSTITDLQDANVAANSKTELQQAFQNADACKSLRGES
jgi:hypothetical protein